MSGVVSPDAWRHGCSRPRRRVALALSNQNTRARGYKWTHFNVDQTKQCANFRHTLPLTKRQTDKQISKLDLCEGDSFSNCDLQQWHSANCWLLFVFYISLSVCPVCRFVKGNVCPKIRTLFSLVDIKNRSFLTFCVFWFIFLNVSSHLCFRLFFGSINFIPTAIAKHTLALIRIN